MPDDQVQFKSPTTGKVQTVPPEHWEEALSSGYTPTTHKVMYAPDGSRGMVPNEQLSSYVKQGYQTTPKTQFEKNVTGQGISLQGAGTAAWNTVKGMVPPAPQGSPLGSPGKFFFGSPSMDISKGTLAQGGREAAAEYQRATAAGTNPLAAGYSAAISGAGPLAGISDTEQQKLAAQGEGGQILGQSAVPLAGLAVAPLLEGPIGDIAAQRRGMTSAPVPKTGGISPEVAGTIGRTIGHATRIPGAGWALEKLGRRIVGSPAATPEPTPFPGATSTDPRAMPPVPPQTVSIAGTPVRTTPFAELPPAPKGEPTPFPRVMTKAELNAQAKAAAAAAKEAAKPPSPFGGMTSTKAPIGNASLPPVPEGPAATSTAPPGGMSPPPNGQAVIRTGTGVGAEELATQGKQPTSLLSRGRTLVQPGMEPDLNNPTHVKMINDYQTMSGPALRKLAEAGDRFAAFVLRHMPRP